MHTDSLRQEPDPSIGCRRYIGGGHKGYRLCGDGRFRCAVCRARLNDLKRAAAKKKEG